MEKLIECLKKKSSLLYDINCIAKYIEANACDDDLRNAYAVYMRELDQVNKVIDEIKQPEMEAFESRRLALLNQIKEKKADLERLNTELIEVNQALSAIQNQS